MAVLVLQLGIVVRVLEIVQNCCDNCCDLREHRDALQPQSSKERRLHSYAAAVWAYFCCGLHGLRLPMEEERGLLARENKHLLGWNRLWVDGCLDVSSTFLS